MVKAVVYPRGFLGFDIGLPVTKSDTPSMQTVISAMRKNESASSIVPDPYISNNMLDDLWTMYKENTAESRSLEFEEKILKAALIAFGTKDFYAWCEIQSKSPYFDDTHRRFLNDTLTFINTGKRKMSPQTWKAILKPIKTPVDSKVSYDYKEYFSGSLGTNGSDPICFRDHDLTYTITTWLSRPDGLTDMLCCLTILFGKYELYN